MAKVIRATGYLKKLLTGDERVLFVARRHWLVRIFKTFWWALTFVLMVAGAAYVYTRSPADDLRWAWIAGAALVPLGGWIWEHLVWRNQMYVMTDWRVLQMDGVLAKTVADTMLEKLNDVKTEQSLLGRIFNYGDILILTASEQGANTFKTIAGPLRFKRTMLEAKEALEEQRDAGHGG
ncbi:PH domain-containing protein [uncultured Brevundimonas sp.]|uniref:PH domain-containing protein n=1 Tax=uncultured Brevundimonas sp. TaxID=213418 RepID=UPI0030EB8C78